MTRQQIVEQIFGKRSFLCIGLDPDPARIPAALAGEKDPVLAFNKAIIDATRDYCVAYKPNLAFYESLGKGGWDTLEQTLAYLPSECLSIADAKRGDIGNTSGMYARTFFETYAFDAITAAPYMGRDSIQPFLDHAGKWTIVLGLTSNPGSVDFQTARLDNGDYLYESVLKTASTWGSPDNMMFVAGATHPQMFKALRSIVPDHFLLVPGVGAQGGDLQEICTHGLSSEVGLLVNVSRSVLYASSGADFAEAAAREARSLQQEMEAILKNRFPARLGE